MHGLLEMNRWLESTLQDLTIMQRKEAHQCRLNGRGRRKMSEANKDEKLSNYSSDLFSTNMDSWHNYVCHCM